jgi:hypothetical protein
LSGNPSLGDCLFEPVERSTVLGDVAVGSARVHAADDGGVTSVRLAL